jgi:integral membrane protein
VTTYPQSLAKPKQIRSALSIYRVMAITAGIALVILIAEMVMKYVLDQTNLLTEFWSPIHGLVYMGYAAAVANLGIKCAWGVKRIVLNLLAGFVPVVPWIAERRNHAEVEAMLQRAYFAGGPAADSAADTAADSPANPPADPSGAPAGDPARGDLDGSR